jgi:hypothetical protein
MMRMTTVAELVLVLLMVALALLAYFIFGQR